MLSRFSSSPAIAVLPVSRLDGGADLRFTQACTARDVGELVDDLVGADFDCPAACPEQAVIAVALELVFQPTDEGAAPLPVAQLPAAPLPRWPIRGRRTEQLLSGCPVESHAGLRALLDDLVP